MGPPAIFEPTAERKVLGLTAFAAHLCWQIVRLDIRDAALCLVLFKSNRDAGLVLFAGMAAAALWR